MVALRPLRRGDVQYRCSKVSRLRQRVDGVQLLDKAAETSRRVSVRSFCTNIRLKRRRKTQSRVYDSRHYCAIATS